MTDEQHFLILDAITNGVKTYRAIAASLGFASHSKAYYLINKLILCGEVERVTVCPACGHQTNSLQLTDEGRKFHAQRINPNPN